MIQSALSQSRRARQRQLWWWRVASPPSLHIPAHNNGMRLSTIRQQFQVGMDLIDDSKETRRGLGGFLNPANCERHEYGPRPTCQQHGHCHLLSCVWRCHDQCVKPQEHQSVSSSTALAFYSRAHHLHGLVLCCCSSAPFHLLLWKLQGTTARKFTTGNARLYMVLPY